MPNYAVFNTHLPPGVMRTSGLGGNATYTNGNRTVTYSDSVNGDVGITTIAVPIGMKAVVEFTLENTGNWNASAHSIGIMPPRGLFDPSTGNLGNPSDEFSYQGNGTKITGGVTTVYGSTWNINDIITIEVDNVVGTLRYRKNGVNLGQAFSFTPFECLIAAGSFAESGVPHKITLNSGQTGFIQPITAGFQALNTQNLPSPAINNPEIHFNTLLYTGTGNSPRSLTELGLSPDLIWIKSRTDTERPTLFDSVRGGTQLLASNLLDAEITTANSIISFDGDGFTVGTGSTLNKAGQSFVAWNWREGSTPGFDIITYTGTGTPTRSIPHSLGATPEFIILKHRTGGSNSGASNWRVFHKDMGGGLSLFLNLDIAAAADPDRISGGDSSVFNVLEVSGAPTNASGATYVAYLWKGVDGFSKFGSYVGNSNADGPFVYCGFRPAFVMIKNSTTSNRDWKIHDSDRKPFNPNDSELSPNNADVEDSGSSFEIDFLANGFKIRTTDLAYNQSSDTHIFAAFAESPFKTASAR